MNRSLGTYIGRLYTDFNLIFKQQVNSYWKNTQQDNRKGKKMSIQLIYFDVDVHDIYINSTIDA